MEMGHDVSCPYRSSRVLRALRNTNHAAATDVQPVRQSANKTVGAIDQPGGVAGGDCGQFAGGMVSVATSSGGTSGAGVFSRMVVG